MENIHVSAAVCGYTCREKFYPDGSCEVLICDKPIFREKGWEDTRQHKKPVRRKSASENECDQESQTRSARRAVSRLRDLALCNDFQCFVTLTLDQAKIDRYDPGIIIRKMSTWCDNKVRRDGLRYILVPEHHKDGAIHFHGFFGWESPINRTLWCRDSGTMTMPGRKAPVRVRSDRHRETLLAQGGQACV